ncbi:unnamed protein product [Polarella glacialis]|uniref:Transmembrane protein n=1 Tax=Polarella glacialis TaxID=89957 RepID=A0A813G6Y8_POLGL|nr:unnamed protein product [Polarella glacialis]
MAFFRLVGRVACATAGLAMAEGFQPEPSRIAGPPGMPVTPGLDLVSSGVYLESRLQQAGPAMVSSAAYLEKRLQQVVHSVAMESGSMQQRMQQVVDGVAMESGRLGAWSFAPALGALGALVLSAEVPALRAQLSRLLHRRVLAPHEMEQKVLRRPKQTSPSASLEAAKPPSAEVADRSTPGLVMAGLLAAAGVCYMARRWTGRSATAKRASRIESRGELVKLAAEKPVEVSTPQKVSEVSTPQKVSVKNREDMPSTSKLGNPNGQVRQLADEIDKKSAASVPQPREVEFHRIFTPRATDHSNLSEDDVEKPEVPEFPEPQFYRIGTDLHPSWMPSPMSKSFTTEDLGLTQAGASGEDMFDIGVPGESTDFTRMSTEPSLRWAQTSMPN